MTDLFSTNGFMPRSLCGPAWSSELIHIHRFSDLLIFAAYVAIPLCAIWRSKKGIPYVPESATGLTLLVGFVATCGMTHLVNQFMFIWPAYRFDALVKLLCALFSVSCVAWMVADGRKR